MSLAIGRITIAMSPSQVLAALQAWDALTLPTNSSLDARGEDGKRYPRERHMLAWDLEHAIIRCGSKYRRVARKIISGEMSGGEIDAVDLCEILSWELKGQITF